MITLKLAEAFIELTVDKNQLSAGLNKAQSETEKAINQMSQKMASLGKTLSVVGGSISAAFGLIVTKTVQLGDAYDKMSKRTNVAVEDLSALGYAAKICGTDISTVENSLRYLVRGMNDAAMGTGEAKEAFQELGISVNDANGNLRPTMDILKEAADKLSAMTDETKQVALATDIFGARYGTQLLPLLKEGSSGIEELMNRAKDLGLVMSTESAAKAAEFNDRLTDLKESIGAAGRNIGELLIPPLLDMTKKVIEIIQNVKKWAETNKPLVDTLIKIGAAMGALAGVAGPILIAVSSIMKMKEAIALLQGVLTPLNSLIVLITANIVIWNKVIREFTDVIQSNKVSMEDVNYALELQNDAQEKLAEKLGITVEELKVFQAEGKSVSEMMGIEMSNSVENATETFDTFLAEVNKMSAISDIMQPAEEAINKLNESMSEYDKKVQEINTRYEEAIQNIGTYITNEEELKTAIDKLNQGREAELLLLNQEKESLDKVAEAKQRLSELTAYLTDKIYEFTHTEYEVKLRDINREYDILVEQAKEVYQSEYELSQAIEIINNKRREEIALLKENNQNKAEEINLNEKVAESIQPVIEKTDELSQSLEKAAETSQAVGILGGEAWDNFSTKIEKATVSLSNFTKEGVAAAIAQIKMKFYPLIIDTIDDINNGMGLAVQMAQYQLEQLKKAMQEQINTILYGYTEYQNILGSMSNSGRGGSLKVLYKIPSYQTGTNYVPKTGLYMLHQGEAVIPASQNTYNTFSPSVNLTVQGGGNAQNIAKEVERVLYDMGRQFKRRGFEIIPGRG